MTVLTMNGDSAFLAVGNDYVTGDVTHYSERVEEFTGRIAEFANKTTVHGVAKDFVPVPIFVVLESQRLSSAKENLATAVDCDTSRMHGNGSYYGEIETIPPFENLALVATGNYHGSIFVQYNRVDVSSCILSFQFSSVNVEEVDFGLPTRSYPCLSISFWTDGTYYFEGVVHLKDRYFLHLEEKFYLFARLIGYSSV